MWLQRFKKLIFYSCVLLLGLGSGNLIVSLTHYFQSSYLKEDYSSYFPDQYTRVVIYGTRYCPYCAMARTYFQERNIPFEDLDIKKSEKALQDFIRLNGKSVPLLLIETQRIEGFNKSAIEKALSTTRQTGETVDIQNRRELKI